jgi:hypothetical protein
VRVLFSFRRELLAEPALRVMVATSLDSDVNVQIDAAALGDGVAGRIERDLAAIRDSLRDALAVFAKVVEIVAALVKATTNPFQAVRALWRALTNLYELLVKHFATNPP